MRKKAKTVQDRWDEVQKPLSFSLTVLSWHDKVVLTIRSQKDDQFFNWKIWFIQKGFAIGLNYTLQPKVSSILHKTADGKQIYRCSRIKISFKVTKGIFEDRKKIVHHFSFKLMILSWNDEVA